MFKKEYKKIISSTIVRHYRPFMSDFKRYDRKRVVGILDSKIKIDINHKDYVEEFGVKWGFGSGNNIGCRVYHNQKKVCLWANINSKYYSNLVFKYKKTPDEIILKKKKIINMIEKVLGDYLYHSGWTY